MITINLLLLPGRPAQPVDSIGRPLAVAIPGPVVGSSEPIQFRFVDDGLQAVDPAGFADAPSLRLSIANDLDPATTPLYVTNALERSSAGVYDLADPSGTYTAEAVAALGVLPALPCLWEIAALDEDGDWAHPLGVVQALLPLRNRSDSLATPEPVPPADLRGPAGKDATIEVGETTTLPAGSDATVENVGTPTAAILNFGIPGSGGSWNSEQMTIRSAGAQVTPTANTLTTVDCYGSGSPRFVVSAAGLPAGARAIVVVVNHRSGDALVEFGSSGGVVVGAASEFTIAAGSAAVVAFFGGYVDPSFVAAVQV